MKEYAPADLLGPLNETERKHAPERLYVAGDVDLLRKGVRVSVVGSRKASEAGLKRAERLARLLVEHGAIVVSGLAEGIDTAAHHSAMRHGGRTIAVLGTPLDRAYPRENAELQDRIAREHLVVSQFPPGSPTRRWNFPFRNRLMALVSSFTVIVEAGDSSGALSQGWEALRLGRRLHLTRSVYDDAALRWPRDMERYGAQVLSDENLGDLLEEIQALQALKWDREAELAF